MGDMKEYFEPYKQLHKKRVEKTPERLAYAEKLLNENGILYKVCNRQTGQINCYFNDNKIITFYAGIGKIKGYKNVRGIRNLIKVCNKQINDDLIRIYKGDANEQ